MFCCTGLLIYPRHLTLLTIPKKEGFRVLSYLNKQQHDFTTAFHAEDSVVETD